MARKIAIIRKSITQLPLHETVNFLIYQIKLKSGLIRLLTPFESKNQRMEKEAFTPSWLDIFKALQVDNIAEIDREKVIRRAGQIATGKVLLFGGIGGDLGFSDFSTAKHWSSKRSLRENHDTDDIKFIWEPARFGWAINLGQAFYLTGEEKFADIFWKQYYEFAERNPLNRGPNWESAQEVALRLIAWVITLNLIQTSKRTTTENLGHLLIDIADHANRILPTLNYACAQNNNHLISEAVGLYTAGTFLKDHPRAEKWRKIGKIWFEKAVERQIDAQGEYIQHSTNYHRMMLTLAIWMGRLTAQNGDALKETAIQKLGNATKWLSNLLDPTSGGVPNFGHNDGTYILSFSTCDFADYRPIVQAASIAFLKKQCLNPGSYNDLSSWLHLSEESSQVEKAILEATKPKIGDELSWGVLRASRFKSRPAHADQLHVDLWYEGNNVLSDAGTYQYNAPAPWDNGLAATRVHNTITIQEKDQMTRAGRFLWLDWAQAHISEYTDDRITAAHDGYFHLGAIHNRSLIKISPTHWKIVDEVFKMKAAKEAMQVDLHWLLPDWEHKINETVVELSAPFGKVRIAPEYPSRYKAPKLTIIRAGIDEANQKEGNPLMGWFSPTYGVKQPATSIVYSFREKLPFNITTDIIFN